jgi:DNA polymerase III subunit epsilon
MSKLDLGFDSNPKWIQRLAVFDLETTGLVLTEARIVTACVLEIDESGNPTGQPREWIANPGIEIPEAASNVHGITTEKARDMGSDPNVVVSEILETLRKFLAEDVPIVAFNAPYDFTILKFEALRLGLEPLADPKPIIDPLILDRHFDKYRPGKRTLEVTATTYGVELTDAHNATADAIAAGRLAQALGRKFASGMTGDPIELHEQQATWSQEQDSSYEEFRRKTTPDFRVTKGWPLKA